MLQSVTVQQSGEPPHSTWEMGRELSLLSSWSKMISKIILRNGKIFFCKKKPVFQYKLNHAFFGEQTPINLWLINT